MGILNDIYSFRDNLINSESKLLSTGEFSLWCALKMFQKEDEEFFSVSSWSLEKLTGLSRNGIYKARKKLIEGGLVEYLPEVAVNKPGQYRFINSSGQEVFSKDYTKVNIEVDTGVITNVSTKEVNTEGYTEVDTKINTGVNTQAHKQVVNTEVDTKVNTVVFTEVNTDIREPENSVYGKAAKQFKLMLK